MMRQDHAGLATWHSINQSMMDSDMVDTTWRSHVVDVAEEFREAGARERCCGCVQQVAFIKEGI